MFKKLRGILFLNSISILSTAALADTANTASTTIDLSAISVHGTGCDDASAKSKSIFADVLQISLDKLQAQAEGPGARERKTCTVRIPITVPPGFRMGIHHLEIEGNALSGAKGNGDIIFRANRGGIPSKMVWKHIDHNEVLQISLKSERSEAQPQDIDWLACNESADIIAQIDLVARQDTHLQIHELYMPMPELKRCEQQE